MCKGLRPPLRVNIRGGSSGPPLAAAAGVGWSCGTCTYRNPESYLACDACGSAKGTNSQAPPVTLSPSAATGGGSNVSTGGGDSNDFTPPPLPALQELIEALWAQEPLMRPTIEQAIDRFDHQVAPLLRAAAGGSLDDRRRRSTPGGALSAAAVGSTSDAGGTMGSDGGGSGGLVTLRPDQAVKARTAVFANVEEFLAVIGLEVGSAACRLYRTDLKSSF